MKKVFAALGAGTLAALAAPATAHAATHTPKCAVVHDHISKTDSGHGTPAEWADLSLNRTTTVCGNAVTLVDRGTLATRPGAGTPNGAGGQIPGRVPGSVHGVYHLTVSGGTLAHQHGDTSLSSTDYVKSLFSEGTTVTGGDYTWTYTTRCGERWVDSSANQDGKGTQAGNITGRACTPRTHPKSPSTAPTHPSGTPSSTSSASPSTMPVGAPQTGDGSSQGGGRSPALMAGGVAVVLVGLTGGGWLMLRRRGQHH